MSLVGKAMIVAVAAAALSCMGSTERRVEAKVGLKDEPIRCRLYFGCSPIIHKPGTGILGGVK